MNKLPDLSIPALRESYRSGNTTPQDLIASIYDQIESGPLEPVWISLIPRNESIARARELGSNVELPLFGVPFAVKDNIDVAGSPTTAACPAFAVTPKKDASVVSRLRKAGAIVVGKTNLDQFATGLVGTRSPYGVCSSVFDSRYISGGSSSGSAVAVASGLVTFSLGTDTAGSGRVPAAFNNIVGLKPSRGLISTTGVVPACRSLDCVSIFALSCADARNVFDAALGTDPNDPFARESPFGRRSLGPSVRIGVPRPAQLEFFGNTDFQRLFANAVTLLKGHGHSVVEIDLAPFRAAADLLYSGPYVAERFAAVGDFVKKHPDDVNPIVRSIVLDAERWTAADAYNALYKLKLLEKKTSEIWKQMDLLLLPTAPTTYTIDEIARDPVALNSSLGYYTNFVNLLDLCAVASPAGFTPAGLPFGVTLIAPTFCDEALLSFSENVRLVDASDDDSVILGVLGAHLIGQPLNYQLTERGARLLRTARTASCYRLFALTNSIPPKPGLVRQSGFEGPGIEIELWSIKKSSLGSFVASIPPPLGIGTCELADGSFVKGFLCEQYAVTDMPEITHLGGWRKYLRRQHENK